MTGGWNEIKVTAIKAGFYEFLESVVINSKESGVTRLSDRIYRAQTMFYDGVFNALSEDVHDIYVLKSRQLGLSTSIRPLLIFWAGIHEGLQGAMVYDTAFNTGRARREVIGIIKGLPARLHFPPIVEDNRDGIVLEGGSQILFMAAGVKNARAGGGLGRSIGLNFAHCSEISSWVNDEGITSFRQSLSDTYPDRLYVWESTARGYNVWYKLWREAKADDLGSKPLFFGWWAKDSQKIERGSNEFKKYGVAPPTQSEDSRTHAVADMYGWKVTREQLAWYRKKTDPAQEREDGDPEDSNLVQEQPWTEDEAFQQTGSNFFESSKLVETMARIAAMPRAQAFRFIPGLDFVSSEVFPARHRREMELRIWEEPAADSMYVVAGDPAFGHNEHNNNSAAQVMRCYADGIDQVAEYATASIQPHQFSWLLWTLVGYYGSRPGSTVLTICELNGPGEEVWRQYRQTQTLVQQGYLRARAKDKGIADIFNNARNYVYQRSDSMGAGHNYQWKTSTQIKIQIMEALRNYWHNGVLNVRSADACEEAKTITRNGDSIGAEGLDRDDRIFSLALGVRAWEEKIRRGMVAGNRTREAEVARLAISIEDQHQLWQRNTLDMFFKSKEAARMQLTRAQMRSGLLAPMRRAAPERRF